MPAAKQPSSPASSIERGADRCFQAARNVLLRAGPTNPVPSLNLVSGQWSCRPRRSGPKNRGVDPRSSSSREPCVGVRGELPRATTKRGNLTLKPLLSTHPRPMMAVGGKPDETSAQNTGHRTHIDSSNHSPPLSLNPPPQMTAYRAGKGTTWRRV